MTFRFGLLFATALLAGAATRGGVEINELHYHPPSHDPRDEFVELLNTGPDTFNLRGWEFTAGVRFTFTDDAVLGPGEFWVVAADPARLQGRHPGLLRVSGSWDGQLSNTGEAVELRSPSGAVVQRVEYADEGDWTVRARGPVDFGHRGLVWEAAHDGGGASLELRQPLLPNGAGQNWAASLVTNGTPGLVNSAAMANLPPLLTDVGHTPAVPRSTDAITIRVRVTDEAGPPAAVTLRWRRDGDLDFAALPMHDDGAGGDALANDGLFAAVLSAQTNLAVVEFFIEAADVTGLTRAWPAPVREDDGPRQTANVLFTVDDAPDTPGWPQLRLVVKAADLAELRQINRNSPVAPFPGFDQTRSHAQMNGTFIVTDGGRTEVRYNTGVRNRGNGSRFSSPQSFRVNLPADRRWNGVVALNLNTQNPDLQILGNALFRAAGLPAGQARPVQLRLNGVNHAPPGAPAFGIIAANEVLDADFADRQFPNDAGGNLYRGQRLDGPGGSTHANLGYRGPDADAYRPLYFKRTNGAEDDWSDLIELTRVLTETPETNFVAEVRRVADVEQWARWFALNTLLDNRETSPVNGSGDDYFLYRGVADPRFRLLPYDLDTILGLGSPAGSATNTLWPMLGGRVPAFERVLTNAEFAPLYLGELRRLRGRLFDVFQLEERLLPGALADARRDAIRDFVLRRIEHVNAQIPTTLTVASDLPVKDALPTAAGPEAGLHGTAFASATRRVLVNGRPAAWSPMHGRWTNAAVALRPGINRILVEAQFVSNITFAQAHYDVAWLPPGAGTDVGGALVGEVTWAAAGSPYRVSGTVTVPAGARLTIEPGATVFFAAGTGLDVRGQLVAAGTPTNRIRFTRAPGTTNPTNSWAGLVFRGTAASNRLANVDMEFTGSSGRSVQIVNAALELDGCTFAGTTRTYVETADSSLHIRGCLFPSLVGAELIHGAGIPAGGFLLVENNVFGTTTGLNDIIDFSRARRPGPVAEFRDNLFLGASDDVLDLDGCDAHVEGNVFLNVGDGDAAKADTSSAISFGEHDGHGPHVVAVRNVFRDVDHVALAKEGGFITLDHNMAVNVRIAAVNFSEPQRGVRPGRGAALTQNVFVHLPFNFENRQPTNGTVTVTTARNVLAAADLPPGDANATGDPQLRSTNAVSAAAATNLLALLFPPPGAEGRPAGRLRDSLIAAAGLQPGSYARAASLVADDLGAGVPAGPRLLSRVGPARVVAARDVVFRDTAAFEVAAGPLSPGWRWRLDGGAWSGWQTNAAVALSGLTPGAHALEVEALDSAGRAQAARHEFAMDPDAPRVRLAKVLALNRGGGPFSPQQPDIIELENLDTEPVPLVGWSLTDDPERPRRFVFPAGAVIGGSATLLVPATSQALPGATGFGLDADGDQARLYTPEGRLADAVEFGPQVADQPAGRDAAGRWTLLRPFFSGPPEPASFAEAAGAVRINEWLAADTPGSPLRPFVELFNASALPVSLAGLSLTDNLAGDPRNSPFPPLSFLAPGAALALRTDGEARPGHAAFRLADDQGEITLVGADGAAVDRVFYLTQTPGVSEGRTPSGGEEFTFFAAPTPGGAEQPVPGTDTDGDGMPDAWELANFLDRLNPADAAHDPDEDGMSNLAEHLAGTDPRDAGSALRLAVRGDGALEFTTRPGRAYVVEVRDALGDGAWRTHADVPAATVMQIIIFPGEALTGDEARFYRVRLGP